jgi:hypothetical protein
MNGEARRTGEPPGAGRDGSGEGGSLADGAVRLHQRAFARAFAMVTLSSWIQFTTTSKR